MREAVLALCTCAESLHTTAPIAQSESPAVRRQASQHAVQLANATSASIPGPRQKAQVLQGASPSLLDSDLEFGQRYLEAVTHQRSWDLPLRASPTRSRCHIFGGRWDWTQLTLHFSYLRAKSKPQNHRINQIIAIETHYQ